MLTVQSPTAAVGAAAVLLIVAVSAPRPIRDLVAYFDSAEWPSPEARRLRGSYRRHSAADAPGRPRKARAPGSGLFT
nr:hypothetical protein [Hoyosella altamirensis]